MKVADLGRKVVDVARHEGVAGLVTRAGHRAARRWGPTDDPLSLLPDDVMDPGAAVLPAAPAARPPGSPLTVGWVITPPGPGSGGHTTIFRLVRALEAAGHTCELFVYDALEGDAAPYERVIRQWWPQVRARTHPVGARLPDLDAYVCTAWQTAHVLASRGPARARCFYLAQDYEPYFYPRGFAYSLAEDSYRFGFEVITIGQMVADELHRQLGVDAVVAPFGVDLETYTAPETPRDGVVLYARPGVARRGYQLGVLAMERFHRAHPDVPLHTFGVPVRGLPFPATNHGRLTPVEVNALYGRCAAGLALSFTNISLIANELLAAGAVPVVNEWRGSRADVASPHVSWAPPTPQALAVAIASAIDTQRAVGAQELRRSVEGRTWAEACRITVATVEGRCSSYSRTR